MKWQMQRRASADTLLAERRFLSKMIIYSTYEVARPADIRLALFA